MPRSRREFLQHMGHGMLIAGLGLAAAAEEIGVPSAWAAEDDKRLKFGELEPLVGLLQDTPSDKLLPALVEKLKAGLDLKQLTAAAALANARTFGGEHYGGFHTFMAFAPAWQMAQELPTERQALPVLKVIYRNSTFVQQVGGSKNEVLHELNHSSSDAAGAAEVQAAVNRGDKALAEAKLEAIARRGKPADALNAALLAVEDNHDVHSVVLPWRAYAMLEFTGEQHALTMLRQSIRKCASQSQPKNEDHAKFMAARRELVPKLLAKYKLLETEPQPRVADDAWIDNFAKTIFSLSETDAADACAAALAEGFSPKDIGEAISLASNALILRQVEKGGQYGKRTHGDSMGVHASDTTNAWRNMIRVCDRRNQLAGLILAGSHAAMMQGFGTKEKMFYDEPLPHEEQLTAIKTDDPAKLLELLDGAVRESNQLGACAIVARYGQLGHAPRGVFDTLLKYAISEDGRLHGEKYYRTVTEEFASLRPAFRWRQLAALARVTASSYGLSAADKPTGRAPGYEEACKLLGIS